MNVLGIRFCTVSAEAEDIANFLGQGLGLPEKRFADEGAQFSGVVFPAGKSWIEVWPVGDGMPAGTMLQVVVDDADAWAENARNNGLEPTGPMDEHGERIYYLNAPGGLPVSFQSKLS
jgi:hypothetical protein